METVDNNWGVSTNVNTKTKREEYVERCTP
jgi:hypothetical protein